MAAAPGRLATARPLLGLLALFSGIALLLNILADVSLPLALAVTSTAVVGTLAVTVRRVPAVQRRTLLGVLAIGAASGVLATLTYDVTKAVLSQVDPSPFNPFEAIRIFGGLLVGSGAPQAVVLAAGTAFHLLNGTCFGIAYTFLFGATALRSRRFAIVSGMGWGLFLETFQLTLYPGWLHIRFVQEFATISALSHLVYGATLALLARALLRRRFAGGDR